MGPLQVLLTFGVLNALLITKVESGRSLIKTLDDRLDLAARVIGGSPSLPHSHPYLVSISSDGLFICGGAIITDNWVLTAAHCLQLPDGLMIDSVTVTAGDHHRFTPEGNEQKRVVHRSDFYTRGYNDDVALLKLREPFDLSASQAAAILLNTDDTCPGAGQDCVTVGWGRTSNEGQSSNIPREANVSVMDVGECRAKYRALEGSHITGRQVCAATLGTTSACRGDSGGPLVCKCGGRPVHAGIVNFGHKHLPCRNQLLPLVYARTSAYLSWINCVMAGGNFLCRFLQSY